MTDDEFQRLLHEPAEIDNELEQLLQEFYATKAWLDSEPPLPVVSRNGGRGAD